jgi:hypothetical protein
MNCEIWNNTELYYEYIKDCEVDVGQIKNYDFENDIPVFDSIQSALYWVQDNINYKKENDNGDWNDEHWQTPEETYFLKTGDCEDYAILFAYIVKNKLNTNIEIEYVDIIYSIVKETDSGHCFNDINYRYIDPQGGYLDLDDYKIEFHIPYEETLWMAIHHHHRVGKYLKDWKDEAKNYFLDKIEFWN